MPFEKGKGIMRIIDDAYRLLGNPLVVIDTSYNVLAHSENSVDDDPLWNELIKHGRFTHNTVNFFIETGFASAVADTDSVALLTHEKLKYDRACSKFFDHQGVQLGSIVVVACYTPFKPEDDKLIVRVCDNLSAEIQSSGTYHLKERVFHDAFINELLSENPDREIVKPVVEELYKSLKDNIYVSVGDISNYEHTLSHLAYLRDLFESMENEFKYFIYLNNIIMIFSVDSPTLSIKRDLGALRDFFIKYNIYSGVSDCFHNLYEIRKYYRQALSALNYGMSHNQNKRIYRFDDYRLDFFLDSIKDSVDISELRNPIVKYLRADDERDGTAKSLTLQTYLTNALNEERTAAQLGLPLDELLKRLREIDEKYDIDWCDGNLMSALLITFKLQSYDA
jgi:sugar diacid utilization regulator